MLVRDIKVFFIGCSLLNYGRQSDEHASREEQCAIGHLQK